ncbi:MAG: hypothetical protein WD065_08295 [Planctomycetaceae bacterium]
MNGKKQHSVSEQPMHTSAPPQRLLFSIGMLVGILAVVLLTAQVIGLVMSEQIPDRFVFDVIGTTSGLNPQQLKADGGGSTGNIVGRTAYARFRVVGDPGRHITVRLAKTFHFLPWKVTEYVDDDAIK